MANLQFIAMHKELIASHAKDAAEHEKRAAEENKGASDTLIDAQADEGNLEALKEHLDRVEGYRSSADEVCTSAKESHSAAALLMQNDFGKAVNDLTEAIGASEQRMKDAQEAFAICA